MNHTYLDHGFAIGTQRFIITAMPSVVQQPRKGPFYDLAMGDDPEALAGMLHDLQVNLMRVL